MVDGELGVHGVRVLQLVDKVSSGDGVYVIRQLLGMVETYVRENLLNFFNALTENALVILHNFLETSNS